MKTDLHSQFANAMHKGDPEFARSLGDALSKQGADDGTHTKAEANYHHSDTEEKCGNCTHFSGKSSCEIVSGNISPDGVSDFYEAKPSDKSEPVSGDKTMGSKDENMG